MQLVFGHAELCVAPAQLQPCWHVLSSKSHFSSVDETEMNSVAPPVCLCRQSKLERLWLDVFAQEYWKIKQDKWLYSFPRFYWMTVEEPTPPSQDEPGQSSPVLPQPAPLILHGEGSHNQKSKLPHGLSLQHPTLLSIQKAGELWTPMKNWRWKWPQLSRIPMQVITDGSLQLWSKGWKGPTLWDLFINLAKKNPNINSSSWHEGGHPVA